MPEDQASLLSASLWSYPEGADFQVSFQRLRVSPALCSAPGFMFDVIFLLLDLFDSPGAWGYTECVRPVFPSRME